MSNETHDEPVSALPGMPPVEPSRLDEFAANPKRALWVLSVPIMFGMSVQALYSMVDMIFVGRVSADALTALSFNMPLLFLTMGAAFGLGSGITAVIAQSIGAGDKQRADRTAEHAVLLGVVITAVYMFVGLVFGRDLLRLLGVPESILPLAWSYFSVLAQGFGLMVMAIFFRSILSGEGEVKVPVMIQLSATVLNIILDPIFIFWLDMGVRGAAIATVVSQTWATAALSWVLFRRTKTYVDFDFRRFRFSAEAVAGIFRIGAPASLSFAVMSVGGIAFNRLLVEHTPDAVAAHQVGLRIDHIIIMPLVAISTSLVTLVGMFYGAKRFNLLRGVVNYALKISVLIATLGSVGFFVFAPLLVKAFTASGGIRELGVPYLRILSFAYPLFPFSMMAGRALQGLGHGTPELILSLLRVVGIAAPLALLSTFVFGLPVQAIWLSMVLGSWISAAVAYAWLQRGIARAEQESEESNIEVAPDPLLDAGTLT